MMSEKMKILDMIQSKQITPQEGAELLKALDDKKPSMLTSKPAKSSKRRMLKIRILSNDGDKVNVQIPIEFAAIALRGGKRKGLIQMDKLEQMNVDVDVDMILEMIENDMVGDIVNIESGDGDIVKIWIE